MGFCLPAYGLGLSLIKAFLVGIPYYEFSLRFLKMAGCWHPGRVQCMGFRGEVLSPEPRKFSLVRLAAKLNFIDVAPSWHCTAALGLVTGP